MGRWRVIALGWVCRVLTWIFLVFFSSLEDIEVLVYSEAIRVFGKSNNVAFDLRVKLFVRIALNANQAKPHANQMGALPTTQNRYVRLSVPMFDGHNPQYQ
jgi:hypothetical protein